MPGIATFETELCWTVQALLHFTPLINAFLESKQIAEQLFLSGKREELDRVLEATVQLQGVSLWVAESRINAIQEFVGNKEQGEYTRWVRSFSRMGASASYFLAWASFRAGQSVSAGEFSRILGDTLPLDDGGFAYLMHMMLGETGRVQESNAAAMMS